LVDIVWFLFLWKLELEETYGFAAAKAVLMLLRAASDCIHCSSTIPTVAAKLQGVDRSTMIAKRADTLREYTIFLFVAHFPQQSVCVFAKVQRSVVPAVPSVLGLSGLRPGTPLVA
jgi:hypothetical protein